MGNLCLVALFLCSPSRPDFCSLLLERIFKSCIISEIVFERQSDCPMDATMFESSWRVVLYYLAILDSWGNEFVNSNMQFGIVVLCYSLIDIKHQTKWSSHIFPLFQNRMIVLNLRKYLYGTFNVCLLYGKIGNLVIA